MMVKLIISHFFVNSIIIDRHFLDPHCHSYFFLHDTLLSQYYSNPCLSQCSPFISWHQKDKKWPSAYKKGRFHHKSTASSIHLTDLTPFRLFPGRTFEGRSVWEPHDVWFPSFPLPRMRKIRWPDISGMLSPASVYSIVGIRKKWPILLRKRSLFCYIMLLITLWVIALR